MHNDTNTSSNWEPSTCKLPRAGRVQEGVQKARSVLPSRPTCLPRASAGGAAVVGAAETTLLPPMRSHKCRQARRGEELTCKYWLKLCKSFCAAGNAYSLPEHCIRSHGQRGICLLQPATFMEVTACRCQIYSLVTHFFRRCNQNLEQWQVLKKKTKQLAFWTTMKNMQKFPLCRGLWKKKIVGAIVD